MAAIEQVDTLIVGSGPAGMATALHLVKIEPAWAQRIVVVDKAVHPREKLCGGAVTRFGMDALAGLGLPFEPAHIPVQELRMTYRDRVFAIRDDPILRITRREEFDHWLVQCGEAREIAVRQGEAVLSIKLCPDYVEVLTERAIFHAKTVVAADGANSFVRRQLKWESAGQIARLLEILTPEVAEEQFEFREQVAVFDFSQTMQGLQGYYWDFPSLIKGQPFMNRGVYDSRIRPERPRVALKDELAYALAQRKRSLHGCQLKGHPIRWFDAKSSFARPRVLLAGDAAGVDPLFGEGISFALAYGEVAAAEITDAFTHQKFDFAGYKQRILAHPLLRQLPRRALAARFLYALPKYPGLAGQLWDLAPWMFGVIARIKPRYVPVKRPRMARITGCSENSF
jgi:flavin-dependent dehydrogenase